MSIREKAISGVFWTFLQQFGTKIISFSVSLVLARILSPADFGLIAMIAVFMGIGRVLINSGLNSSLIRATDPDDSDYSTVFIFNLIGSVVIYSILYTSAPFIAKFYDQPILTQISRVYGLIFIINAFAVIQMTRLTKKMDFRTQLIVSLPSLVVGGIVGISMAVNGYGVWSLVWSAVIQSFVAAIQYWFWSEWRPKMVFDKQKFRYHFDFGIKLAMSGMLNEVFKNAYTIIIGKFFPVQQLGLYYKAENLKQLPASNIGAVLNKVTFPLFAEIKDDNIRLKEVYRRVMKMVIFVIAPILIFMSVLGEPLFRFLFTEKWLGAVPYFQIIAITGILYPIHAYNLNVLTVKGRSDLFLRLEIIKKIVIVSLIALTLQWGIYGLLFGSVCSSIFALFINTYYTGKFIDYSVWQQLRDLLPSIAMALVSAGAIRFFDYQALMMFQSGDFFRLVVGSLIGTILYLALNYFFKQEALYEFIKILQRK